MVVSSLSKNISEFFFSNLSLNCLHLLAADLLCLIHDGEMDCYNLNCKFLNKEFNENF